MVTIIDKGTRVLGIDPMEYKVDGPLYTHPFLFLLITSALTLATLELFFYK